LIYLSIAVVTLLGLLVWQHISHGVQLDKERASHQQEREMFERLWDKNEKDRQVWANRVQAPDVAVAQTIEPGEDNLVQFTRYDDDADFNAALKELER
jgi:hypothetical protein